MGLFVFESNEKGVYAYPIFSIKIDKENKKMIATLHSAQQKLYAEDSPLSIKVFFNDTLIAEIIPMEQFINEYQKEYNKKATRKREGKITYTKDFLKFMEKQERMKVYI